MWIGALAFVCEHLYHRLPLAMKILASVLTQSASKIHRLTIFPLYHVQHILRNLRACEYGPSHIPFRPPSNLS